jgi:hypothetical protein
MSRVQIDGHPLNSPSGPDRSPLPLVSTDHGSVYTRTLAIGVPSRWNSPLRAMTSHTEHWHMRLDQSHYRCQLFDCGLVGICFIFYRAQTSASCISIIHVQRNKYNMIISYITQLEKQHACMDVVVAHKQILDYAN